MDELQIKAILSRMAWTKHAFRGVYSSNTLPEKIYERPCALVVNTDEEHEPGSHWIAIYLDENGDAEYFDSYGLPPLSNYILDFLKIHSKQSHWTFNDRQLQHAITTMCGGYCIFFLMYRCRYHQPLERTIDLMFPQDENKPLLNDMKIQRSLLQRFGLEIPLIEMDFVQQQLLQMYKQ